MGLYMSTPIGFDIFFHVFSYQPSIEFGSSLNRSHNLFGFTLPRYFFLSYIYYLCSYVGLPVFFMIVILVSYPLYSIVIAMKYKKRGLFVIDFLTLIFCFLLVVFYSALSLSLLWFIAFILTRKKIFSFGFFHPVALVFLPIVILINRRWAMQYVFVLSFTCFSLFSLIGLDIDVFSVSLAAPVTVSFENFWAIITKSILIKYKEFSLLLILAFAYFFTRRIRICGFSSKVVSILFISLLIILTPIVHERSLKGLVMKGEFALVSAVLLGQLTEKSYNQYKKLRVAQ